MRLVAQGTFQIATYSYPLWEQNEFRVMGQLGVVFIPGEWAIPVFALRVFALRTLHTR